MVCLARPKGSTCGGGRDAEKSIGIWRVTVSTIPLLPPVGGEADRDSAAPTAATVVEVCKIWESHLRAVGVAAIARVAVALVHAPDNNCCCWVAEVPRWGCRGWGTIVLVVMNGRWIGVDVPELLGFGRR
jgi:hypothetical protein